MTPTNDIPNWESLIAERSRPAERMAESIAKEANLQRRRAYDSTPKRKSTWTTATTSRFNTK